jgi:hypothetical protein
VEKTCPELVRTFQSDRLCQNFTFWENKPCPKNYDGNCNGNYPGQCKPPIRLEDDQKEEIINTRTKRGLSIANPCQNLRSYCIDNSQLICDASDEYEVLACSSSVMKYCDDKRACIHHSLECDGYIQCPDRSDEEETKCRVCPRNFGYPAEKLSFATFSCKHRYTGRWICAVPCDGHDDLCENFADEDCEPGSRFILSVIVCILLIFISIIGETLIRAQKCSKIEDIELENVSITDNAPLRVLMHDLITENGENKILKQHRQDFHQVKNFPVIKVDGNKNHEQTRQITIFPQVQQLQR